MVKRYYYPRNVIGHSVAGYFLENSVSITTYLKDIDKANKALYFIN